MGCVPPPSLRAPALGPRLGSTPLPPAPLPSGISLPFRRIFKGALPCPLDSEQTETAGHTEPEAPDWPGRRPVPATALTGPQPPACRPEPHLCSAAGPVPHAVGTQTVLGWRRRGRGQQAPAAAPGSRAHPRGIGPAPGQRLTGGRDRPTHIWRRLFKRLRSSSRPPPPARLGASSQLFLFYQGVRVGSLKPPSPPQAGLQGDCAQRPGGTGARTGPRVCTRAADPGGGGGWPGQRGPGLAPDKTGGGPGDRGAAGDGASRWTLHLPECAFLLPQHPRRGARGSAF